MQYGSCGWALGALLGVAVAVGHFRRVVAVMGDGAFQMSAQVSSGGRLDEVGLAVAVREEIVVLLSGKYF